MWHGGSIRGGCWGNCQGIWCKFPCHSRFGLLPSLSPPCPEGPLTSGIGRQRNGQGCPRGHLFLIQESGCKPARSHWKDIRVQSALACGSSLWSNKWHWFCRAQFFVAVCILILSIFDVSGRGWAVMWKMTPFFCQKTNEARPKHSRELPLKWCLCLATLQSIIFKLGSLDAIGTYKKGCSDCNSHFSHHPL